MIVITEKQRQEAIASCDRIVELNNDIQRRFAEIIRIFDEMAKPRAPEPKMHLDGRPEWTGTQLQGPHPYPDER